MAEKGALTNPNASRIEANLKFPPSEHGRPNPNLLKVGVPNVKQWHWGPDNTLTVDLANTRGLRSVMRVVTARDMAKANNPPSNGQQQHQLVQHLSDQPKPNIKSTKNTHSSSNSGSQLSQQQQAPRTVAQRIFSWAAISTPQGSAKEHTLWDPEGHDSPVTIDQKHIKSILRHAGKTDVKYVTERLNYLHSRGEFQISPGGEVSWSRKTWVTQLNSNLFLGGEQAATRGYILQELGITHIVNVTHHLPRLLIHEGLKGYMQIRALDSSDERLSTFFGQASDFIDDAIKSGGTVLVHCFAGISRSTTILLAYLIKKQHLRLQDAYNIVAAKRPFIRPNRAFCLELKAYDATSFGVEYTPFKLHSGDSWAWRPIHTWQEALSDIFCLKLTKRMIIQNTGRCYILWSKFKEAFAKPTTLDSIASLLEILNHGLFCVGNIFPDVKVANREEQLLDAFCKTLVMGMTYAHCSKRRFLGLLRGVLVDDNHKSLWVKCHALEHLAGRQSRTDFASLLCDKTERIIDSYSHRSLFLYDDTWGFDERRVARMEVWSSRVDTAKGKCAEELAD